MVLGGEIDYVAGRVGAIEGMNEQLAGAEQVGAAGLAVTGVVGGETVLELFRQALAHDADAVDGVDEGLGVVVQDVTGKVGDHGFSLGMGAAAAG